MRWRETPEPRLYRVIVAALDTGCRLGELLWLRWLEVDLDRRELRVLAITAKTTKTASFRFQRGYARC